MNDLTVKLSAANEQLDFLRRQLTVAQAENDRLKAEVESERDANETLNILLKDAISERDKARAEVVTWIARYEDRRKETCAAEAEVSRLKDEMK